MIPAPSPLLKREGLLTEADEKIAAEDAVKGIGKFRRLSSSELRTQWTDLLVEYVRARVKNVHDRKTTRIADNNPDGVFKVKNLAVQDYYA